MDASDPHGPSHGSRNIYTIVALAIALASVPGAWADEPMHWYVAPDDDTAAWQASAAQTWAEGSLLVQPWTGEWPPTSVEAAYAFFEGALPGGTVVIHTQEGPLRRIPVMMEGVTHDEARKAVLLVVGSIVHPLGIADGGWLPDRPAEAVDETTAPPVDGPDLPTNVTPAPAADRSDRVHVAMALGSSARPGLDRPCFAPSARLGIALGPAGGVRVSVLLDLSADLFGQTWANDVPLQLDAIGLVGGLEVRLGTAKLGFPVWAGGGVRTLTASRGDNETGGYPLAVAPLVRLGGGISVEVGKGVRLGAKVAVGLELVRGDPPIQLQVGEAWEAASRDLLPLSVGGQIEVEIDALRGQDGS